MTTHPDLERLTAEVAELRGELRALGDRQQIHDLYRRYMWGFDRRDLEIAGSAFWPDAQINYGTVSYPSGDAFLEDSFVAHEATHVTSRHLINLQNVEVDGDVAHVEAYVTEFSTVRDDRSLSGFPGCSRIVGARYVDRVDRRDDEWRIAVRETFFQFMTETDTNRETLVPDMLASYAGTPYGAGGFDRDDVAFVRPLLARAVPPGKESDEH
jgi:hypothetical protein